MKYVNCPNCEWTLGVPEKLLGSPVSCPKCVNDFVAQLDQGSEEKPAKKKRARNKKPKLRSLPTPPQISGSHSATNTENSDVELGHESQLPGPSVSPAIPTPKTKSKNRLRSPHRPKDSEPRTKANGNRLSSPASPSPPAEAPEPKQQVAKIISADPVNSELGVDGELPTLQLKESTQKRIDTKELKKKPVFLGVVICLSVLSSGLMLFFADFSPAVDEAVLNQARQDLKRFYSVREDVQLRPFQLELREAQLAHSRNDRKGEIAAYRKIMTRFRAEDKSQFVGVTGSPGADIELEKLVSILLGDGKNKTP